MSPKNRIQQTKSGVDLNRRDFMAKSAAAAAVSATGARMVSAQNSSPSNQAPSAANDPSPDDGRTTEFSAYSRFRPSFGGPPDNGNDNYLGKLVPGLRAAGLEPVPLQTPDLGKLPWKMVDGAKEFHIHCTPVRREFLPGYVMNVWGYNGSMPGPSIEAVQGDRVRLVVHNELPEPTTIHWHGLELPVQFDGVPGLTQEVIAPAHQVCKSTG